MSRRTLSLDLPMPPRQRPNRFQRSDAILTKGKSVSFLMPKTPGNPPPPPPPPAAPQTASNAISDAGAQARAAAAAAGGMGFGGTIKTGAEGALTPSAATAQLFGQSAGKELFGQ